MFLGALDVLGRFMALTNSSTRVYLFIAYGMTCLLFVGWGLVYRDVTHKLAEAQDGARAIAAVGHLLAEAVRMLTVVRTPAHDEKAKALLNDALGDQLQRFLRGSLDCSDVAVTVKTIRSTGTKKVLVGQLRLGRSKPGLASLSLNDSVVYKRFQGAGSACRSVYISDMTKLETSVTSSPSEVIRNNKYRTHADSGGFRSVLAFPMREPTPDETTRARGIIGFVSLDSPDPHAFDRLFQRGRFGLGRIAPERPQPEIEFFYGIADALAAFELLMDNSQMVVNTHGEPATGSQG